MVSISALHLPPRMTGDQRGGERAGSQGAGPQGVQSIITHLFQAPRGEGSRVLLDGSLLPSPPPPIKEGL